MLKYCEYIYTDIDVDTTFVLHCVTFLTFSVDINHFLMS